MRGLSELFSVATSGAGRSNNRLYFCRRSSGSYNSKYSVAHVHAGPYAERCRTKSAASSVPVARHARYTLKKGHHAHKDANVCAPVYVHMQPCTHSCTHAHTHASVCARTHTHVPTQPCQPARVHTRAHARTHAHTHARTQARTPVNMHVYVHVCAHTHAYTQDNTPMPMHITDGTYCHGMR